MSNLTIADLHQKEELSSSDKNNVVGGIAVQAPTLSDFSFTMVLDSVSPNLMSA